MGLSWGSLRDQHGAGRLRTQPRRFVFSGAGGPALRGVCPAPTRPLGPPRRAPAASRQASVAGGDRQ